MKLELTDEDIRNIFIYLMMDRMDEAESDKLLFQTGDNRNCLVYIKDDELQFEVYTNDDDIVVQAIEPLVEDPRDEN